ncbi:MAG: trypsin-like serine peptidase [Planctomycetota bacterium]|jgi:V8-like Glu-specific endopeptidase
MRLSATVGAGLCAALLFPSVEISAQTASLQQQEVTVTVDSGLVRNPATTRAVIYTTVVRVPGAPWVRLTFDRVDLGDAPEQGQETVLRITSVADGAIQTHKDATLEQWRDTSAYFNGDAVRIELVADAGAGPSRVVITRVLAGRPGQGTATSICGPTDDRLPSAEPRAGRALPVGCTAWIIGDTNNCLLTAGHCSGSSLDVIEFNVPDSDGGGNIQHPGPEDQYAVDPASQQSVNGGVGNDWGYFGCFTNSETGLTPFEAQGDLYMLADSPPPVGGQTIRITGYGVDNSPPEWNQVQQTHTGPYVTFQGSTVQYQVDTQGGNSGSAVLNEDTGEAIGIHTHGGCDAGGGQNSGTGVNNAGLQSALASPRGVCVPAPPLDFSFPDGLPERLDPAGDAIRVEVSGQNGGTPQPGTGVLHYDVGGGFVEVDMTEITDNVYDAVFPAIACGTTVRYYFSAEAESGEVVTNPLFAPDMYYSALSAVSLEVMFSDDFEADLGWSVTNEGGLTDGQWERGTPAGGGDRGDPPADADGSGQCYVTDNADGNSDVDEGTTILTSPVMDATQGPSIISYFRWFSNTQGSSPFQDVFVVEVSDDDGANWVELETVGPDGPEVDGGWFEKNFLVEDVVEPTNAFRIRFIASDTDPQSVVEAGVDGVRLSTLECGADDCPWDLNDDGTVGISDLLMLLAEWGNPYGINDLLALLADWGGCP